MGMVVGVPCRVITCHRRHVLMVVLVFDVDHEPAACGTTDLAHPGEGAIDHQHPAAAQPEVATLADEFEKDPCTKNNQRDTNNLAHPFVEPIGDRQPESNSDRAEREYDGAVAQGVEHRQHEPAATVFGSATEISDCCDVVPVEAMTHAERERRQQQPQRHTFVYRSVH